MKSYTIKNTDIQINGKLFPEGSTIELSDKDAEFLSDYLVTLDVLSRAESRDEVSWTNNKKLNTKNKTRSK